MRLSSQELKNLNELVNRTDTAKFRYRKKVVISEKPDGSMRERTFIIPNTPAKKFQHNILDFFTNCIEIPNFVFSKKGKSHFQMVLHNKDSKELQTMDIKKFFESVHYKKISYTLQQLGLQTSEATKLTGLITSNRYLPLGFPTSPFMSNLIFLDIDKHLHKMAKVRGIKYSRYVDDMAFSGKSLPNNLPVIVTKIIGRSDFKLNTSKTSPVYHLEDTKVLLGLQIDQGQITITNEYKVKVMEHVEELELLTNEWKDFSQHESDIASLKGELSFIKKVDKESYNYIFDKYLAETPSLID